MTVLSVLAEALFGKKPAPSWKDHSLAGAITSGLYEISRAMNATGGDVQRSLDLIVSAGTSILRVERSVILLRDEGGDLLSVRSSAGIPRGRQFDKYRQEIHDVIFSRVMERGEGMIATEGREVSSKAMLRLMRRLDVKGFLAAPVQVSGEAVGVMAAATPLDRRELSDEDLKLLTALANFAGVALENAEMVGRLKRKARKLTALFEISRALNEERDAAALFQLIVDRATELMGAPSGSMILVDRASGRLRIEAERGLGPEVKEEILLRIGEGVTGWVAKEGKPLLVPDVSADPRYVMANPKVRSEMAVPIRWGDEVAGVLNLDHHEFSAFTSEDLELLIAFGNVAAVALRNADVVGRGRDEGKG